MSSKGAAVTGLAKLLNSEKYSDLKLVCQGQEFKVHKAIVCSQSPVIAAACDGAFQEAQTNILNIEEFDAETVRYMVAFMYEGDYKVYTKQEEGENGGDLQPPESPADNLLINKEPDLVELKSDTSQINVRVNAIADYYDIPKLKELSNMKIKKNFDAKWSPDEFSAVISQVFSTGDKALQEWATSIAAEHIEELIEHPIFRTAHVTNDFGLGIIQKLALESKETLKETREKLKIAEQRCRELTTQQICDQEELQKVEVRANRLLSSIRDCIEMLSDTKECRNPRCEADFTCYIEQGGNQIQPTFTLRCARCRCRHK